MDEMDQARYDASVAMIVAAIEMLPDRAERRRALLSAAAMKGIGLQPTDYGLQAP